MEVKAGVERAGSESMTPRVVCCCLSLIDVRRTLSAKRELYLVDDDEGTEEGW